MVFLFQEGAIIRRHPAIDDASGHTACAATDVHDFSSRVPQLAMSSPHDRIVPLGEQQAAVKFAQQLPLPVRKRRLSITEIPQRCPMVGEPHRLPVKCDGFSFLPMVSDAPRLLSAWICGALGHVARGRADARLRCVDGGPC